MNKMVNMVSVVSEVNKVNEVTAANVTENDWEIKREQRLDQAARDK